MCQYGPDHFIEPPDTTMQGITIVIRCQLVLLSIQCEFRMRDAVSIAANETTEIWIDFLEIAAEGIKAEDDIAEYALFIGDEEVGDGTAVVQDVNLHAFFIHQGVLEDGVFTDQTEKFGVGFRVLSFGLFTGSEEYDKCEAKYLFHILYFNL